MVTYCIQKNSVKYLVFMLKIVKNLGKLIVPTLTLFIVEIVLGAIVFLTILTSLPLAPINVFTFGVTAILATLIIPLIIAFVFAGVIIALISKIIILNVFALPYWYSS